VFHRQIGQLPGRAQTDHYDCGDVTRQNRVLPNGELVAVPDRGLFWGNRGQLLDRDGNLARYSRGRNWLICVLEFKGRRRTQWLPGRLTELYFLDEATGLAAGHRPCGECRIPDYRAFKAAWNMAHPGGPFGAPEIDRRLHEDRLAARAKRTYQHPVDALPVGVMIELAGQPWLVLGDELRAWTTGGYRERRPRTGLGEVTVLTPRCTVSTLLAGYRPTLHPSAFN
jgi:hypothetical protein